mgnify:CR=1 FL=1
MTINTTKNNDKVTFQISGRLDTTTAPELEKAVNELGEDAKELIIDMKELEYISSAGLRVLLAAQKKMKKTGSMKLSNVGETVMEVLEITGFSDVLTIE